MQKVFKGSEFKKNLLTLFGGTAIAQSIPIICAPLLTRLFNPDEFGLFANFVAITAFISIFISGKYELAIILPKKNEEAINVLSLACLLALFFSFVLFFVFFFLGKPLSTILEVERLANLLWLVPVSALFVAIYSVFNEWCIRKKNFVTLSKNKISNTGGIAGSSLIFGITNISSGLVFGEIIGRFISSLLAVYRVLKEDLHLFKHVSIQKMRYFSRRYFDFARFNIPGQFLNTIAGQLPILLLTAKFGIYEIGLFSLTERVLGAPLTFIGNSLKDVFKQRAAQDYQTTGNCLSLYKKTTLTLLALSIIPFAVLFISAPFLFSFFFGTEWYMAGEYARILCFMYMINFISMPTGWLFVIAEKQKWDFLWQTLFLFFTLLALFIGIASKDMKTTLLLFCIGRSIAYIIQIYLTYNLAKGKI